MRAAFLLACILSVLAGPASAAKKGTLRLQCSVSGATVEVDGRVVGKTPLGSLKVSPGEHALRIRKAGFLDYTQKIRVSAGGTVRHSAELEKVGKAAAGGGGELDLDLEPLAAPPPAGGGKSAGKDDLELEPLPDLVAPSSPVEEPALVPALIPTLTPAVSPATDVTATVPPAEAWYQRKWVWGATGAAVLGGAVAAVLAVRASGSGEKRAECGWELGDGSLACPDGGISVSALRLGLSP